MNNQRIRQGDKKEQGIKFGQSEELKNAMKRGGVLNAPEISFAE
jgi:hypothetical protein